MRKPRRVLITGARGRGSERHRKDPLLPLPELVRTPHHGGLTREVIDNGVLRAVENIQLFLDGRPRDLVVPPAGR